MSHTLFLISGDSATIISRNNLPSHTKVIPFSEKQLLSIRSTIRLLKQTHSDDSIVFGMKRLHLQRYHQILKGIMLLSGKTKGFLADEEGNRSDYSRFHTLFSETFRLLFEIFASVRIVVRSWFVLRYRAATEKGKK